MSSQKQDLGLFSDGSIIPQKHIGNEHLFGLITQVQGTAASWLVNLLIENSLYGTCAINHDKSQHKVGRSDVILISFVQNFSFYEKDLKKNGIELSNNKNFHFIDLFTDLFQKISTTESITKLLDQVVAQVTEIHSYNKVVFIEGLELLLSATSITSIDLLGQIHKLQKLSSSLFIIASTDKELIGVHNGNINSPEFKTFDFLVRLLHRSNINISLRPLDTGKAKDVTGTLTISRGTIPYKSLQITEKEYLFLITKDQTTKLFFR